MMRLPIRTRLAFWFSGILFAGMLVFSAFLYYRYENVLQVMILNDLKHECTEVELLLQRAEDREFVSRFIDHISAPIENEHDFQLRILGADGQVLVETPALGGRGLPFPREAIAGGEPGTEVVETAVHPQSRKGHRRVTVLTRRIDPDRCRGVPGATYLQIAQSNRNLKNRLARFRLNAGLAILLLLAFSVAAGLFLTRKALKPVSDITAHAAAIGASDLDKRLPVRGTGDELDSLAAVLNSMFTRLQAAFSRNRRFAAAAAHQLRTPLTTMRGELETMGRRAQLPEDVRQNLLSLQQDVDRMAALCRRMLLLMKVEAGAGPQSRVGWREVDLTSLISDLVAGARSMAAARGVTVEFRPPDREIRVMGNAGLLGESVFNLVDNGIKFTPRGGCVRLTLTCRNATATIEVRDDGPGVPEEVAQRIFERFQRADEDGGTTGFGLGLPIARGVITRHGGRVELDPTTTRGATFRILLPLASDEPPAP